MWVHDKIWAPAPLTERHIFLIDDETADTFLTVAGRELITDFRPSGLSCHHFNQLTIILVRRDYDPVNI